MHGPGKGSRRSYGTVSEGNDKARADGQQQRAGNDNHQRHNTTTQDEVHSL